MLATAPSRPVSRSLPQKRTHVHGRSHVGGKPLIPGRDSGVSGRRYYSSSQGRFLGRDPKYEMGDHARKEDYNALHLYAFCGNNAINRWDYLGMYGSIGVYIDGRRLNDWDDYGGDWDYGGSGISLVIGPLQRNAPGRGPNIGGGSTTTPTNILANANIVTLVPIEGEPGSFRHSTQLSEAHRANLITALNDLRDNGGPLGRAFYEDVVSGRVQIMNQLGTVPGGTHIPASARTGNLVGVVELDLSDPSFMSQATRERRAQELGISVDEVNRQVGTRGALILGHELGHAVLDLRDPVNVAVVENAFLRPAMGITDPRTVYGGVPVPDISAVPRDALERVYRHAGLPPPNP